MFLMGKIIPQQLWTGAATMGTGRRRSPFHRQHETGGFMYIGLGGILVLILILWLLGVI
jgi:hypothetical protein